MQIVSASYNQFDGINVVLVDQPPDTSITVPTDPANKDYVELQEWAAKEGNEIKAYEAPPAAKPAGPTVEERLAALEAKLDARA
jgi:hypothetical protein